jgi:S1-C subfamily serine protease/photosystem II stability/assembly factor-like uncharacterized protein
MLAAVLAMVPISLGAQEAAKKDGQASTPQSERDRKLDDVLKMIEELRRQVEEMRRDGRPTATVAAAPAKPAAPAVPDGALPAEWVKSLRWRSIGPAGMGGRITDISVYETDPCIYWIATASGGLLKTTNNGVTFEHQFDHETTVSVGSVCVAPSNPNIVWVGTGENNPRNSVSYGDGVYKSTDGGKTWTHMGLNKTFQIGRVVVHPKNPDIVYVGALGRLYGPNPDRGLFKTTDGGKTWQKVHYIDDKTGVVDIAMHPTDPETLIIATWERQRDGFDSHRGEPPVAEGYDGYDPVKKWGPGAGLFKTTDGGKTFNKLTKGLPSNHLGRMDVDYYRKDPKVVYAIIDCEKIGMGTPPSRVYLGVNGSDVQGAARLSSVTANSPGAKAGLKAGDVLKAIDKKPLARFAELPERLAGRQPGDKLVFEIVRDNKPQEITVTLENRPLSALVSAPTQAFLGVQGEDATGGGARLTQITEGGPAEKATLRAGDVIKSANKEPITSYEHLTEVLRTRQPGDKIAFEVVRDEKTIEIAAVMGERPTGGFGGFGGGGGGFGAAQLLGAITENAEGGLRVSRLFEDRLADKAGIVEGDIIQQIDAKPLTESTQLLDILREHREGDKVTLKVKRDKETKEIALTLEAPGTVSRTRPWTFMYAGQQPNVTNQQGPNSHEYGGVYQSNDGGESWTRINSLNPRPMYFSQIRVDPSDNNYLYVLGVSLHRSKDGGKTFTADGGNRVHADQHALWIDPRDGRHMVVGTDGGFYVTYDRMTHWEHLNHMAIAQFYHVAVDSRHPYRVYGGLQDNGSWGGPSQGLTGSGPINADWISVGSGDGFVCRVDPFDPDIVYSESQDGNMGRRNLRTGERASLRPRPERGKRYRFNWNTPFILSNHNSGIYYAAGNYVFRSVKRGDDLRVISPEIARTGRGTGTALAESPINPDVLWVGTDDGNLWITRDGGVKWTNIAEKVGLPGPRWVATIEPSRFAEGRCYVAFDAHRSDDDEPYVYVTEDFGETWKSLRANLPWGSTRCLREDPKNQNLLLVGTEFGVWASLDRGTYWARLNNNLPTVAVHELAIHPTAGEVVAATHGRSLWVLDIAPLRQMSTTIVKSAAHLYEPNAVIRWRTEPSRGTGGGSQHYAGDNPTRSAQIFYSIGKKADKASLQVVDIQGQTVRELAVRTEPGLHVVSWDLSRSSPRGGVGAGGPGGGGRGFFGGGGGGSGGSGRFARGGSGRGPESGEAGARPTGGRREGTPPAGAQAAAATPPAAPSAEGQAAPRGPGQFGPGQRGPGGPGGPGGGLGGFAAARVSPGEYRIVLTVDGQQFTQTVRVESDPTLPNGVIAGEADAEAEELLRKVLKRQAIDD